MTFEPFSTNQPGLFSGMESEGSDRARRAHPEPFRRLAAGQPPINYRNDTLPKIVRKGFGHACWPPAPACSLNQINADSGIPFDSIRAENALGQYWLFLDQCRLSIYQLAGRYCLQLCDFVAHLNHNYAMQSQVCPRCDSSMDERAEIFSRYTAGETRIICNVATLDTGLDLDIRCVVDARPTQSRMNFVQRIGRGLRIADGKLDFTILDHAGNHTRLGVVTEINVRHLLKGKDEPVESDAASEPDSNDPRSGAKSVFEREGTLVELDLAAHASREPKGSREVFYSMLSHYAKSRGYKVGWASVNVKERFGYFPPRTRYLTPVPPDPTRMCWIFKRQYEFSLRAQESAQGSRRAANG
jgi:helicase-like protein